MLSLCRYTEVTGPGIWKYKLYSVINAGSFICMRLFHCFSVLRPACIHLENQDRPAHWLVVYRQITTCFMINCCLTKTIRVDRSLDEKNQEYPVAPAVPPTPQSPRLTWPQRSSHTAPARSRDRPPPEARIGGRPASPPRRPARLHAAAPARPEVQGMCHSTDKMFLHAALCMRIVTV